MANTYTWIVEGMDCVPQDEGKTDAVVTVHWRLNGTDGHYASSVYGTVALNYEPGLPFTPYNELTQDQVVEWVKNALGPDQVKSYEDVISGQIQARAKPSIITPPLPWE